MIHNSTVYNSIYQQYTTFVGLGNNILWDVANEWQTQQWQEY